MSEEEVEKTNAAREKTWEECSIEERIERLRREMRSVRESLAYQERIASRSAEILRRHMHGPSGEVFVSADMVGESSGRLVGTFRHDSLK